MTEIRQTSTNYVHPTDPNLLNIHKAMKFNADGEPVVRTHVDGITLEGNVIVDTVSLSSSTLAALETVNVVQSSTPWVVTGSVIVSNFPTTSTVYQGTNPWVVTGNVNVTTTQTDIIVADSNYEMNVARGLVDGQYVFSRSALNPSVDQDVLTSIWVEGGIYPHGLWTTAQRLFVVSDSTADTGQTIFIEGLDSNYVYQTDTVTTNGTSGVLSTKSFLRLYTATVTSASTSTANTGEIRLKLGSNSGLTVGHIRAGFGITKLSQYTVPAGYTAYVVYGDATTFRGGSGNIGSQIRMMVRPYGGSFLVAFIAEVVNGYYRNDFNVPMKITEKSDIDIRVIADANNTIASCNYQMILIQN
jgi:hypothetical protein